MAELGPGGDTYLGGRWSLGVIVRRVSLKFRDVVLPFDPRVRSTRNAYRLDEEESHE